MLNVYRICLNTQTLIFNMQDIIYWLCTSIILDCCVFSWYPHHVMGRQIRFTYFVVVQGYNQQSHTLPGGSTDGSHSILVQFAKQLERKAHVAHHGRRAYIPHIPARRPGMSWLCNGSSYVFGNSLIIPGFWPINKSPFSIALLIPRFSKCLIV